MHFDSLLVSLELKGRTLTATFTEPDMVEVVVIQSHKMFSYKKKQNNVVFSIATDIRLKVKEHISQTLSRIISSDCIE